jgi:hypothetical protein
MTAFQLVTASQINSLSIRYGLYNEHPNTGLVWYWKVNLKTRQICLVFECPTNLDHFKHKEKIYIKQSSLAGKLNPVFE